MKSISDNPKKRGRGRPATGRDPMMGVRMPPALRQAIKSWCEQQEDRPSLAEAIRRLVQRQLASEGAGKPSPAPAKPTRAPKPVKATKAAPVKKKR
jgi:hypothetical protein